MPQSSRANLDTLPHDLHLHLFLSLSALKDVLSLSLVCRQLQGTFLARRDCIALHLLATTLSSCPLASLRSPSTTPVTPETITTPTPYHRLQLATAYTRFEAVFINTLEPRMVRVCEKAGVAVVSKVGGGWEFSVGVKEAVLRSSCCGEGVGMETGSRWRWGEEVAEVLDRVVTVGGGHVFYDI
ncbi:hypothetical protein EDC01DRAFT_14974 [Geopyxis carbonaria]|nr:hypothetical protein EDC01DRAFT_14974 [Geopyxis carbonaria]